MPGGVPTNASGPHLRHGDPTFQFGQRQHPRVTVQYVHCSVPASVNERSLKEPSGWGDTGARPRTDVRRQLGRASRGRAGHTLARSGGASMTGRASQSIAPSIARPRGAAHVAECRAAAQAQRPAWRSCTSSRAQTPPPRARNMHQSGGTHSGRYLSARVLGWICRRERPWATTSGG